MAAERPVGLFRNLHHPRSYMSGIFASVVSNVVLAAVFFAAAVFLTMGIVGIH